MSDDDVLKRLRDVEKELAVEKQRVSTLETKVDSMNSGINRGLWLLGGGFISSVVAWIIGGGLVK